MPVVYNTGPNRIELTQDWIAHNFPLHPVVPRPSVELILHLQGHADGDAKLKDLWRQRQECIHLMKTDPLRYGYEPQCWKDTRELLKTKNEVLIQGGNRASKTWLAAKLIVETLRDKPEAVVWCLHSTLPSSIEMQQPIVKKFLPPEWRNVGKRGRIVNISWTDKNGFSEQVFVCPPLEGATVGSRCRFLNYSMEKSVIEGGDCDIIWCDELVPYDWVETLRYRLVSRRGKLIITFTPVNGFSLVVKDYMAGSVVTDWRPSPLLYNKSNVTDNGLPGPIGQMPYIRQCANEKRAMIYFFTQWNPFNDYQGMVDKLQGLREDQIKIRAYGYTERVETAMFPKFGDVHIVPPEKVPAKGTNYCVADPAGTKNWFIKWYRVVKIADDIEHTYVYREWPDYKHYGEWAVSSERPEGRPGPAQRAEGGKGILDYKRIILEAEGWQWDDKSGTWDGRNAEHIESRFIDPRFGSAEIASEECPTSICWLMEQEQRNQGGNVIGPSMIWLPALVGTANTHTQKETSVSMIADLMDYDTTQTVSVLNCPRWYVSKDCEQSIFAYREFNGCGEKECLKDIVDCDRYLVRSDCHYVDPTRVMSWGGGGY